MDCCSKYPAEYIQPVAEHSIDIPSAVRPGLDNGNYYSTTGAGRYQQSHYRFSAAASVLGPTLAAAGSSSKSAMNAYNGIGQPHGALRQYPAGSYGNFAMSSSTPPFPYANANGFSYGNVRAREVGAYYSPHHPYEGGVYPVRMRTHPHGYHPYNQTFRSIFDNGMHTYHARPQHPYHAIYNSYPTDEQRQYQTLNVQHLNQHNSLLQSQHQSNLRESPFMSPINDDGRSSVNPYMHRSHSEVTTTASPMTSGSDRSNCADSGISTCGGSTPGRCSGATSIQEEVAVNIAADQIDQEKSTRNNVCGPLRVVDDSCGLKSPSQITDCSAISSSSTTTKHTMQSKPQSSWSPSPIDNRTSGVDKLTASPTATTTSTPAAAAQQPQTPISIINSIAANKNRVLECDFIPSKKSRRRQNSEDDLYEYREEIRDITPLPGFLQAFGSTEIGRFSETFLNTPESPAEEVACDSEADNFSPLPWEVSNSLEGPHYNLHIGAEVRPVLPNSSMKSSSDYFSGIRCNNY